MNAEPIVEILSTCVLDLVWLPLVLLLLPIWLKKKTSVFLAIATYYLHLVPVLGIPGFHGNSHLIRAGPEGRRNPTKNLVKKHPDFSCPLLSLTFYRRSLETKDLSTNLDHSVPLPAAHPVTGVVSSTLRLSTTSFRCRYVMCSPSNRIFNSD